MRDRHRAARGWSMLDLLPAHARCSAVGWIFWPRTPGRPPDGHRHARGRGARIRRHGVGRQRPRELGRSPRLVLLICCSALIPGLKTDGLTDHRGFTNKPDAVIGQQIYDAKFDPGAGAPAVIITNAGKVDAVIAAASKVPGRRHAGGRSASRRTTPSWRPRSRRPVQPGAVPTGGCEPAASRCSRSTAGPWSTRRSPTRYDTPAGIRHDQAICGPRCTRSRAPTRRSAAIGGQPGRPDTPRAHDREPDHPDRAGGDLARAGAAAARVAGAGAADRHGGAVVRRRRWASARSSSTTSSTSPNADPSFPLFAFVFLVALGIDYNIFLMTRVREETLQFGTRARRPARPGGHRRGDHLGRARAGGDVRRAGRAADGVPGRDRFRRGVRRAAGHVHRALACWCRRCATTSAGRR